MTRVFSDEGPLLGHLVMNSAPRTRISSVQLCTGLPFTSLVRLLRRPSSGHLCLRLGRHVA